MDWMLWTSLLPISNRSDIVLATKFSIVLNEEIQGFFFGKKGLRQGDPISLHLCLLVMETFSSLLEYKIARKLHLSYKMFIIWGSYAVFDSDYRGLV